MLAFIRKYFPLLLALAGLAALWSCNSADVEDEQYLTWNLSSSLKDYDIVDIRLVSSTDSSVKYDSVWHGKIDDPANFPKYKLREAKGKDFTIRIRGYNKDGELVMAKDIKVVGKQPEPPVVGHADVRLFELTASPATLSPAFSPNVYSYTGQVAEEITSIKLSALPLDLVNVLSVDTKVVAWGENVSKNLDIGANVFTLTVSTKDGKDSKSYSVNINRGRIIPPEEITDISLKDTSLNLWLGDPVTQLKADVTPAGAAVSWSSSNENVATVDATGKVKPIGSGNAEITVSGGSHSAVASVKVKKDAPVVKAGDNIPARVGEEVTFNITLSQEHGSFVYFKYDLDGDGNPDNLDTTNAPASLTLKHTYNAPAEVITWFEAKDTEGWITRVTRVISISNSAFQLAIISPSKDTTVRTTPITILYRVNGTELTRSVALKEGPQAVSIDTGTGTDKVSRTLNITLDTQGPAVPVVTVPATTSEPKPTWTWAAATNSGGVDLFRYSLDSAGLAVAVEGAAKTYTPSNGLLPGDYTLYVQERDSIGNWSLPGKGKVTIKATDTTPPNAPNLSAPAQTGLAPKWTWTSGGGGGAGIYKFKLGDSAVASATESNATEFTMTETPVSGVSYTLYVSERDSTGNYSKVASKTVLFDNTKPTVSIAAPQPNGTYPTKLTTVPFSGTVSGPYPVVKVSYLINGLPAADADFTKPNWSIPGIALVENTPTLVTVVAIDDQGNKGQASVTLVRDNTKPGAPNITTFPATPSKSLTGGFAWTAGSDNTSGSGLNGNYRWSFDAAAWTETSSLQVTGLTLKEGSNTFYLQEQDQAGNWSDPATKIVIVDNAGPAVSVTTPAANATLSTVHVTVTGTVSDALTSVASVNVTGSVSGVAPVSGGTFSTADLILRSGLDTLIVTATDALGNTTVKTVIVTVNVALPALTIDYPTDGMPYNMDTITVRYTISSGAQKQLFTTAANTPDGNWALQVTSPPNEAGQTTKQTVTILRDKTGPVFPTLSPSGTNWTITPPSWTFTSGGDGTGGGVANVWNYSYTFNGGTPVTGSLTTNSFSLLAGSEGTYAFNVRQQDKAGNFGAYSAISTLKYDKTPNSVSVSLPLPEFVTNTGNVSLVCKLNGVDQPAQNVTLTKTGDTVNVLTCSYPDSAGNPATATTKVWYRPTVYFVKTGTVGGDGSSWAKAFATIRQAMAKVQGGATKQIWVAGGNYDQDPGDTGLVMKTNLSLYGGFNPAKHTAIGDRTFAAADTSYLRATEFSALMTISGVKGLDIKNVTVDGFSFQQIQSVEGITMGYANGISLKNLQFTPTGNPGSPSAISAGNAVFTCDNCLFSGYKGDYYTITASPAVTMTMNNSTFTGNVLGGESGGRFIYLEGPKEVFFNTKFLDNPGVTYPTFRDIQYTNTTGTMDFTSCTFRATNKDVGLIVQSSSPNVTYSAIAWITP